MCYPCGVLPSAPLSATLLFLAVVVVMLGLVLSTDGTHGYQTTDVVDPNTSVGHTLVSVIDTGHDLV